MSCYRQFTRERRTGRFIAADALADCRDDGEAMRRMGVATETLDLELWDGPRLIVIARHENVVPR